MSQNAFFAATLNGETRETAPRFVQMTGAFNRFLTDLFERPSELLPPPDVAIDAFAQPPRAALAVAVLAAVRDDATNVAFFLVRVDYSPDDDAPPRRAVLMRRFSDFVALRDALRANFPSSAVAPLPAKTYLGSVTDAIVTERAAALHSWARDTARQFFAHAVVQAFFALAPPTEGADDALDAVVADEAALRAEFAARADLAALRGRCNAAVLRECALDDSAVRRSDSPYRALALAERSLWCKQLRAMQLHDNARVELAKQLRRRSRDPPTDNSDASQDGL